MFAVLAAGLGGPAAAQQAENRTVIEPLTVEAIPETDRMSVSVDTGIGSEIEVILPAQATTGFEWQAERANDLLRLVAECEHPGDPDRLGSAGTHRFIYRAESAGLSGVTLRYVQPWVPDEPAITVELTITITE